MKTCSSCAFKNCGPKFCDRFLDCRPDMHGHFKQWTKKGMTVGRVEGLLLALDAVSEISDCELITVEQAKAAILSQMETL